MILVNGAVLGRVPGVGVTAGLVVVELVEDDVVDEVDVVEDEDGEDVVVLEDVVLGGNELVDEGGGVGVGWLPFGLEPPCAL